MPIGTTSPVIVLLQWLAAGLYPRLARSCLNPFFNGWREGSEPGWDEGHTSHNSHTGHIVVVVALWARATHTTQA
jgi:hypothetical protein